MKLLYCPSCHDVFSLSYYWKTCRCGKATGRYIDELNAEYRGGVPIGIANDSFDFAVSRQSELNATAPNPNIGTKI